jgi:DNA repair ATPase RecN
MVFDEIDANVGGEIARAVGKKMAILGELHQVIAITHFPQVAATAAAHFVVEKEVVSGRTLRAGRDLAGYRAAVAIPEFSDAARCLTRLAAAARRALRDLEACEGGPE